MSPTIAPVTTISRLLRTAAVLSSIGLILALSLSSAQAADPRGRASVSTTVSPGYTRTKLPDGSFKTETYAFGNGGCTPGFVRDESIDAIPFLAVAADLIDPLARRGYVSCKDPEQTQLLIMVHWGTTAGSADLGYRLDGSGRTASTPTAFPTGRMPAGFSAEDGSVPVLGSTQGLSSFDSMMIDASNIQRGSLQRRNAQILGYSDKLDDVNIMAQNMGVCDLYLEITGELEDSRYFVVLVAYDFQKAWKQKQLHVLWTTRFSLRTRGNHFDQQLHVMAEHASKYFGRDSGGLVRSYLPAGTVTIEASEVLGEE